MVDPISRERIMESLFDPARVIDRYVIDQNRYIQKFSNMGSLSRTADTSGFSATWTTKSGLSLMRM